LDPKTPPLLHFDLFSHNLKVFFTIDIMHHMCTDLHANMCLIFYEQEAVMLWFVNMVGGLVECTNGLLDGLEEFSADLLNLGNHLPLHTFQPVFFAFCQEKISCNATAFQWKK
jgi:hypothetical protein